MQSRAIACRCVLALTTVFVWLCVARAKLRDAFAPRRLKTAPKLVITTGASSDYFSCLTNLIGSVHYWCPTNCIVAVFCMNLNADEIHKLRVSRNTVLFWETRKIPDNTVVDYGFKPLAIEEALISFPVVLWLDAGSTVTGNLYAKVMPILQHDQLFVVQGQDNSAARWLHSGMLEFYGVNRTLFEGKPSYSGNTIGFTRGHPALREWVECAKQPACISPPGSSPASHRYDQAAITIILYLRFPDVEAHTNLLAGTRKQLAECFKESEYVVWTSRCGETCYESQFLT